MSRWTRTNHAAKAYSKRVNDTICVEIMGAYDDEWIVTVQRGAGTSSEFCRDDNGDTTVYHKEYDHLCPEPETPNGYHKFKDAKAYGNKLVQALKDANFK